MSIASDRFVLLRGGLALPVEPYLLLLDLEARGLKVTRDGDDVLVRPGGHLTPDDCQQFRRWKLHVLALLDYVANSPEVQ